MSCLTLTLRTPPRQSVDLAPLTPDRLAGLSLAAIAALPLHAGNRVVRVDDLFDLSGRDTAQLSIVGGTARLSHIGCGMSFGRIEVAGDAGAYLGKKMRGGRIEVAGGAGAWAACEMRGGELVIGGDAGDFLGAALPGDRQGMAGGVVLVRGSAGDRVGDHMRRGLILIEGGAGAYLGARMTAGTIAVAGPIGPHPGYAMNRGTLLLYQAPEALPPTFNDCGTHALSFLPLLLKSLGGLDTAFHARAGEPPRVRRWAGDFAGLGKGEILVALAS